MTKNQRLGYQKIKRDYASGKRKPVFKGEKRPKHSIFMKNLYLEGKWIPPDMQNEKNPAWRAEKASYSAFHHWLANHKERKFWCFLGDHSIKRKSEFANVNGNHNHDIDNYIESCTSCHRLFDYNRPLFF